MNESQDSDDSEPHTYQSSREEEAEKIDPSSSEEDEEEVDKSLAQLGQDEKNMVKQMESVAKGSIEKGRHVRNQQVFSSVLISRAFTIIFSTLAYDFKSYLT